MSDTSAAQKAAQSPSTPRRPTRLVLILAALLIILATLAAYIPALQAEYIWDDDSYLTKNATLTSPGGLWRIWFEIGATPQYYPLVFTTFLIEHRLWGLNPLGYHLVNVLLHAASAVLLWLTLKRLSVPGAYLAAAVFALHPVHVESVAWITERKNVLSGMFGLASMLVYLLYCGVGRQDRPRSTSWLICASSLFLFVCALLSKTVVCGLPVVLMMVLWWKREHLRWATIMPLILMLPLSIALGLQTSWVEKHIVWRREPWQLPNLERIMLAGRVPWFYLRKLLWPHPLMFSYPRWDIDSHIWWQYLFPAAVIAALAALWLLRSRIGRGPLVAVASFLVLLFPALGFFSVYPMQYSYVADHFQYHASIGIITLAAVLLAQAANTVFTSPALTQDNRPLLCRVSLAKAALASLLLLALGAKTWHQARLYSNSEILWEHTLSLNPQSWVAHLNLGRVCYYRRDIQGMVEHLGEAIRLNPEDARDRKTLADGLVSLGRYDEAAKHYQEALKYRPNDGQIHHNLANILSNKGQTDEAVKHYRECLRCMPNDPLPRYSLGMTLQESGKPRDAIAEFRAALRLRPDWPEAQRELAWLLATHYNTELRNGEEAVRLATAACKGDQNNNPLFLDTLAAALAQTTRLKEASQTARKALTSATSSTDPALVAAIRQRLALYEQGLPYIQPKTNQR